MRVPTSPALFDTREPGSWLFAFAFVAAYVALDWASYIRPLQGLNITPWNPQAALVLALLIRNRGWAWLAFVALVAAEFAVRGLPANWLAALSAIVALCLTYAAMARAIVQKMHLAQPFSSQKDLTWFAVIIVGGSLLCAVVYVLAFSAVGFGPGGTLVGAVARYWVGDAVGLAVALPLLLIAASGPERASLLATLRNPTWWATTALSGVALWVTFGRGEQDYFKYFYLLLLPVVWAAARFGVAGAVLSSAFTQVGLIVSAQIALRQDLTVFELQALMAASTMTALLLGVLVDERARGASDLRRSLRFAAAGQMSAALAHELSQPLTALNNYAQASRTLATAPGTLDAGRTQQLSGIAQRIVDEAQRAADVVKRLRDLFSSGATSLRLVPAEAALHEAIDAHLRFAEAQGVAIAADFEPGLPAVWVDSIQIAIVLRNLLANAIESAAVARSGKRVVVRAMAHAGEVVVHVEDGGTGVDADRLAQLFESPPSGKPGGLGVGLSICREIVEAHGGKLWAEAGPGGHFFFTLPIEHHDSTVVSPP